MTITLTVNFTTTAREVTMMYNGVLKLLGKRQLITNFTSGNYYYSLRMKQNHFVPNKNEVYNLRSSHTQNLILKDFHQAKENNPRKT